MEFQPQTRTGKLLVNVLEAWMGKSPEFALDKLKQMLVTKALRVKNEDGFLAALYSQKVLDETPSVLSQRLPSTLSRVQYGMETSLNKNCAKEFVVALEQSENQSLLCEICCWTAKNSEEIQHSMKRASSIDLAPVKVQKVKLLSEIMTGSGTPRYREISWTDEEKHCTALEVFVNMIVVGWNNGQVKVYNSTNLNCQTVLNYGTTEVTCLQCTGTEIIAGYEDGNICVWNIQRGVRVQTLSVVTGNCPIHFPTCMRWRDQKLIAGTAHGRIHIWQYANSSFALRGSWDAGDSHVCDVDFNENYVILGPSCRSESVKIHDFNGDKIRSISSRGGILQMALRKNILITCNRYGTLEIWDITTGTVVKELKDLVVRMFGSDSHNGVIASGNRRENVTVWKIDTALEGSQAESASLPHSRIKCVPFDAFVGEIKLGPNFVVAKTTDCEDQKKIFVTDFLS